jgi:hypothetical protein
MGEETTTVGGSDVAEHATIIAATIRPKTIFVFMALASLF